MGFVDLHVHSNASDGTCSPTEVVCLAKEAGLTAIALTDHDTTAGVSEAIRQGELSSVEIIPGIEVSSTYKGKEIHILGLFVDPCAPALIQFLENMRERRNKRNEEMLRRFAAAGITFTREELTGSNPDTVITRAHVARALVEKGLGTNRKQVFKKYLEYGGAFCPMKEHFPPEEVVSVLKENGAFISLAHPFQYQLGDKETETLIASMAEMGMQGLEVYHSSHNSLECSKLREIALRYRLLPTGGSDFHGGNKPDISIGKGRGNLRISSCLLDDIKQRLKKGHAMKVQNITNVEKFFEIVNQCKGTVELVSPEGDRINLKSRLAQYLSMATIFSNGYIKELELIAHEPEDVERLIHYMCRSK